MWSLLEIVGQHKNDFQLGKHSENATEIIGEETQPQEHHKNEILRLQQNEKQLSMRGRNTQQIQNRGFHTQQLPSRLRKPQCG